MQFRKELFKMLIRNVNESDFEEIYNLVKNAFETAKNSTGNEREFVSEIRNKDTYIPECEFVAEKDGKIIGHVILSKQDVETDNGGVFHGVRVEQIVVAKDERDNRLGGMLICNACMMAAELGYPGAFVVGDPEYFGKFGFIETAEYDIENVSGIDDKFVLACPTCTGGFRGVKGKVNLH